MTSVSQFAQYLLKLDPQRNQARFTLYNFMKTIVEPTLPFSPAIIQAFYARVLQFDHWQNDAEALSATVKADLEGYVRQYCLPEERAAWESLRHSDTLQVVQLKVFQDLEDLVHEEFESRLTSGDQLRMIRISEQQILALTLAPSGTLEAMVYPNLALVWGSKLRLVAPVSHLYYTPELELMPHVKQLLEGSLLTTHSFTVDTDGVHGIVTRGATFQKFETFIRANLPDTQDLFSSLKKIERHFINPQSDPHYQETVAKLERANRLLNNPTQDNLIMAEKALNRGRITLKNIFPNDRLLTLLVTHLDYGISQRRSQTGTPAKGEAPSLAKTYRQTIGGRGPTQ